MEKYQSNSHKSKEDKPAVTTERRKVEKVVQGTVKTKKKSELKKFTNMFISEDVGNIKTYVVRDVIIPTVKDAIIEVVKMFFYGGDTQNRKNTPASRVSYGGFYNQNNNTRRPSSSEDTRARSRFDYDDIVIGHRGEAEEVLDKMYEILSRYDVVSVLDFYDAVGLTAPHTANKYGWTDLSGSKVLPVRGGGYTIKLPRAMPLD